MVLPAPALIPVDLGRAASAAGIRAAFTTRAAGNLGLDVGDDPGAVHARRSGLRDWAGVEVSFAHHVHGSSVLAGGAEHRAEPVGDAWCADVPCAVGVLAADCLPVLFADPAQRVIGAAHAGRVGLLDGVLEAAVGRMGDLGARDISAVIGPSICGKCYEVSPELADEALARGFEVGVSRWGTPALDLPSIARGKLEDLGVGVTSFGACTLEDPRFFSHRSSDRFDGRQGGLIVMR